MSSSPQSKTPSKASILHLYGLVIGAILVCVVIFPLLYGGGGATVLLQEQAAQQQAALEALPTPSPTPEPPKVSRAGRLIPFLSNGLWGYKNTAGEVALPPAFSAANEFEEEVAFAAQDGLYGLIDRNGLWLAEPAWSAFLPFSEGRAAVLSGEKWGFIDEAGAVVIDYQFREVGSFACGRAMSRTSGSYGYIDPLGNIAVSEKFRSAGPFSSDVAFASQSNNTYIINKAGEPQITLESGVSGTGFSEGFALVKKGGSYYFITKYARQAFASDALYEDALPFSGGYAAICQEGLWGYINAKGETPIRPQFAGAASFSGGFAAVQNEEGLWAYIDTRGALKTDYVYSIAQPFLEGYAVVKRGADWLVLNKTGEEALLYSELS